jgi:hypothetical protein
MFPVPEKPTVSDLRVRPLFERYWRYEPLFCQDSEYIVAAHAAGGNLMGEGHAAVGAVG